MNFDQAFDRLIGIEAGYTSGEGDPGGETKYGISKRSYPQVEIKNLTVAEAKAIYLRDFWQPIGEADDAIKYQLFDFVVNSSIQTAIRYLQRAVGSADDGHWGPISAAKLSSMDVSDVLMRLNAERLDYMRKLSTWPRFGSGWAGRIAANLRYAAQDN